MSTESLIGQLMVAVVDGKESAGIFKPSVAKQTEWSLHTRSPLVVMFQRLVVKTVLASAQRLVQEFKP